MNATRTIVYTLVALIGLSACSPNAGGTAEYYREPENINVRDRSHPNYDQYVIRDVFFGAHMQATDQTTVTGKPPYSVTFGAMSLTRQSVPVEVVSARAVVNGSKKLYFTQRFSELHLNTKVDRACDDCGDFGSVWTSTDHFLQATPSHGDDVVIYIVARVGTGEDTEEREFVFEFEPKVKDIGYFQLPGP
jgi:hypothetical protein